MTDARLPLDHMARRRAIAATGLVAAVVLTTACSTGPLPGDQQRESMVATTSEVVEHTAEAMNTKSVAVTDDAAETRACPDGGQQYVYAATIGPLPSSELGTSDERVLAGLESSFLGLIQQVRTAPMGTEATRFDNAEIDDPATPDGDRRVTYRVPAGDHEGMTLSFVAAVTGDGGVVVNLTGRTRCG